MMSFNDGWLHMMSFNDGWLHMMSFVDGWLHMMPFKQTNFREKARCLLRTGGK